MLVDSGQRETLLQSDANTLSCPREHSGDPLQAHGDPIVMSAYASPMGKDREETAALAKPLIERRARVLRARVGQCRSHSASRTLPGCDLASTIEADRFRSARRARTCPSLTSPPGRRALRGRARVRARSL